MNSRSLLSSAALHFGFLAFLLFSVGKPTPLLNTNVIQDFDFLNDGPGGSKGTQGGRAIKTKLPGQTVPQPPSIKIPKKFGPTQPATSPEKIWNVDPVAPVVPKINSTDIVPAGPASPEKSSITHVGIPSELAADGAIPIGVGNEGLGDGDGNGVGNNHGNGLFRFHGYLKLVRNRIWSEWSQSALVGSGEACVIGLTVDKEGSVSDVKLEKPSKNPMYNMLAMRAVRNASPLPPLPTGFSKSSQRFRIQFKLLE